MLAAYAAAIDEKDPLAGLEVGDVAEPEVPDGWTTVQIRAAALNRHDLWALQGVGLDSSQLPMILGSDASGVDEDGRNVIVHALVGDPSWRGDETLDPRRSLLSEVHPGTFSERVAVPRRNLVPLPASLSFEEAACLPTAWLTAYRMLFVKSGLEPGQTVLVQGAAGGVASAAIALGWVGGFRVWATSRDEEKRQLALELGAEQAFEPGARLPERVDAVIETVGEASWQHSLRSLRPGGRIVIAGATTGYDPPAGLNRVFFLQHSIVGSTMGTLEELEQLVRLCELGGVRPLIDSVLPLTRSREAMEAMLAGRTRGKIVLRVGD